MKLVHHAIIFSLFVSSFAQGSVNLSSDDSIELHIYDDHAPEAAGVPISKTRADNANHLQTREPVAPNLQPHFPIFKNSLRECRRKQKLINKARKPSTAKAANCESSNALDSPSRLHD